jgi:flagellar biosynthetic protein FliR
VIEFTAGQLTGWVMLFFWPFVRILSLLAVAPVFGENSVPRTAKIGLALLITWVIAPTLHAIPNIPPVSFAGVWLLIQQILIGVAIGLVMRVAFAAVQAAGDIIGLQMGLGFASFYSAAIGANTMVLAQILNTFAMLLFIAFNGHLVIIGILADTFTRLPLDGGTITAGGWQLAANWGGTVFASGLSLAMPLVASLLTINIAMGILNRASPQLSIFSIGFPLTLLAGLTMLFYLTPQLGELFRHLFMTTFHTVDILLGPTAPANG